MKSQFLIVLLCVLGLSCAQRAGETDTEIWEASVDNGDKPGNGLRLIEKSGQMSAVFFLLNPNRPHDFSGAIPLSTTLTKLSNTEFKISVVFEQNVENELILRLKEPLRRSPVYGLLQDIAGDAPPIEMKLIRVD